MPRRLKPGDQVEWNTSQGTTSGTVEKEQISPARIKRHRVAASPSDPQYIVKGDKSGKMAAHRPEALRKRS